MNGRKRRTAKARSIESKRESKDGCESLPEAEVASGSPHHKDSGDSQGESPAEGEEVAGPQAERAGAGEAVVRSGLWQEPGWEGDGIESRLDLFCPGTWHLAQVCHVPHALTGYAGCHYHAANDRTAE